MMRTNKKNPTRAGEERCISTFLLDGKSCSSFHVFLIFKPLPNPERAHPRLEGRKAVILALTLEVCRYGKGSWRHG